MNPDTMNSNLLKVFAKHKQKIIWEGEINLLNVYTMTKLSLANRMSPTIDLLSNTVNSF